MKIITGTLIVAFLATSPAAAEPGQQLTRSVAIRLAPYGVDLDPASLTTAQASALHLLLVTTRDRSRIEVRRRAENILRSEEFRD